MLYHAILVRIFALRHADFCGTAKSYMLNSRAAERKQKTTDGDLERGMCVCVCKGCTKKVDIKIIKQQGVKSVKQFPQCKFYDPAMQWKRK